MELIAKHLAMIKAAGIAKLRLRRCCAIALIACTALLLLLAVNDRVMADHLVVQLPTSTPPVVVNIQIGGPEVVRNAESDAYGRALRLIVHEVRNAGSGASGRVIALHLVDVPLWFDALPAELQQRLTKEAGDYRKACAAYEQSVASLLLKAIRQVKSASDTVRLSVVGLPLETAGDSNDHYREVLDELGAFVLSVPPPRQSSGSASGASTDRSRNATVPPQATRPIVLAAAGRPIYFVSGRTWMVAVGTTKPDPETAAGGGRPPAGQGDRNSSELRTRGRSGSTGAFDRFEFFVTEDTSPAVKATYNRYGARDALILYQGAIDPDNNGMFEHEAKFKAAINQLVPPDYTGPVVLEWKGKGLEGLMAPPDSVAHARALEQYLQVLKLAQQMRPNAQFGFDGLPMSRHSDRNNQWLAMNEALKPIYDQSNCLFPTVYDLYSDKETPRQSQEQDVDYVRECVSLAIRFARGKPVYACIAARWHNSNPDWGFMRIPEEEFKEHIGAIFDAQHNGDRADGVIWWGADRHHRWISTQKYSPSHPSHAVSQRLRSVFEKEIPPGVSDDAHFDQIHVQTLQWIADVIKAHK